MVITVAQKFDPYAVEKAFNEMKFNIETWLKENKDHPAMNLGRNALDLLLTFGSTFIPALDTKIVGLVKGTQNYTADTLRQINEGFIRAYSKLPNADSSALTRAQTKLARAQELARKATLGSSHIRNQVLHDAEEAVARESSNYDRALNKREQAASNLNNQYQALQQMALNPTFTAAKDIEETVAEWNK